MQIRLEHDGLVLHETDISQLTGEIRIGRGHTCEWHIPEEDRHVSSEHLRLYRKGRQVWVRETDPPSKNGSFINGQRIRKPIRLSSKDKVVFGGCVLSVDDDPVSRSGKPVPEVVILTGKAKGQIKPVSGSRITIGSDPASTVLFMDDLVSREHAEIVLREDGSCWIRDLKSKNGTSVNGMALREGQERMLKDGDLIGVAQMELRFQDGTVQRSGRKALIGVAVLAATVSLVWGLRWTMNAVSPPVSHYVEKAEKFARKAEFVGALAQLERAKGARDASVRREYLASRRQQVSEWSITYGQWMKAQEMLRQGLWGKASNICGLLGQRSGKLWRWGSDGDVALEEFEQAKALLDADLAARAFAEHGDGSKKGAQDIHTHLQTAVKTCDAPAPEYLQKLLEDSKVQIIKTDDMIQLVDRMEKALDGITSWPKPPPEYKGAQQVLEFAAQCDSPALKARAERLKTAVDLLAARYQVLQGTIGLVHKGDFDRAFERELSSPMDRAILLDSRLGIAWNNIKGAHSNILEQADDARTRLDRLNKLAVEVQRLGGLSSIWRFSGDVQNVLDCDSLLLPFSKKARDRPLGQYDRYLGIEYFYDYLLELTDPEWGRAEVRDDFPRPIILLCADLFKAADHYRQCLQEYPWLSGGVLRAELRTAEEILASQRKLVSNLLEAAGRSTGRRAILLAGMASRLAPDRSLKIKGEPLGQWVNTRMQNIENTVSKKCELYENAVADEQIRLRNEIWVIGLPGNKNVKHLWMQKL